MLAAAGRDPCSLQRVANFAQFLGSVQWISLEVFQAAISDHLQSPNYSPSQNGVNSENGGIQDYANLGCTDPMPGCSGCCLAYGWNAGNGSRRFKGIEFFPMPPRIFSIVVRKEMVGSDHGDLL
jgi:hypothetical protein